jgi:hypothetical protein
MIPEYKRARQSMVAYAYGGADGLTRARLKAARSPARETGQGQLSRPATSRAVAGWPARKMYTVFDALRPTSQLRPSARQNGALAPRSVCSDAVAQPSWLRRAWFARHSLPKPRTGAN